MAALVRNLQADGVFNDIRKLYDIASGRLPTRVPPSAPSRSGLMIPLIRVARRGCQQRLMGARLTTRGKFNRPGFSGDF